MGIEVQNFLPQTHTNSHKPIHLATRPANYDHLATRDIAIIQ